MVKLHEKPLLLRNYRGVAIFRIVCGVLTQKLYIIISKCQHGFVKGRSTCTNLVEFVSHATKVIESMGQLDVVYNDFKRAFDRVKHSLLIWKLGEMGIHSKLLEWVSSYLTERSQYVKISGCKSRDFRLTFVWCSSRKSSWSSSIHSFYE